MKLLVCGHSVLDSIDYSKSDELLPGGIFYSSLALSQIKVLSDEVVLLTNICKKYLDKFSPAFKNFNLKYSISHNDLPKVRLEHSKDKERREVYSFIPENLDLLKITNYDNIDGIYLNMVSGFEFNLNQLKYLRNNYRGIIYMDYHTLSRGVDEGNVRNFRPLNNWKEWFSCINVLQMNEAELASLNRKTKRAKTIVDILSCGVNILLITNGSEGVNYYIYKDKKIINEHFPAIKVESIHTVGCGDVFGAVFFYYYCFEKNIKIATRKAVHVSGILTTVKDLEEFERKKIL